MSVNNKRGRDAISKHPVTKDYEVGHGKPPDHSRFKAGQSGNPKGRPKGSRNKAGSLASNEQCLAEIIKREAHRKIIVNDAKGSRRMPLSQAIVRSIGVNAAKGHQRSQRLFVEMLHRVDLEDKRAQEEFYGIAIDYKMFWEGELQRRETLGIVAPPPLPHPDYVIIDPRAGTVQVRGPCTKKEQAEWDHNVARRQGIEKILKQSEAMRDDPKNPDRSFALTLIERAKKALEEIREEIGPWDDG